MPRWMLLVSALLGCHPGHNLLTHHAGQVYPQCVPVKSLVRFHSIHIKPCSLCQLSVHKFLGVKCWRERVAHRPERGLETIAGCWFSPRLAGLSWPRVSTVATGLYTFHLKVCGKVSLPRTKVIVSVFYGVGPIIQLAPYGPLAYHSSSPLCSSCPSILTLPGAALTPQSVEEFLSPPWSSSLAVICVRETFGNDSELYVSVQTVSHAPESFLWVLHPLMRHEKGVTWSSEHTIY